MKRKLFLNLLVASVIMVSFQSCEKDDDLKQKSISKIEGIINFEGSLDENSVYAYAVKVVKNNEVPVMDLIGESKIRNNKFSISLKTPADKVLENITTEIPKGITVSDEKTRGTALFLWIKKENEHLGTLTCSNKNPNIFNKDEDNDDIKNKTNNFNIISLLYSDREVKIFGTSKDEKNKKATQKYDLTLHKGWNILNLHIKRKVEKQEQEGSTRITTETFVTKITSSTSIPKNCHWYFIDNKNDN